jgi:gp16 family phage-associated protein
MTKSGARRLRTPEEVRADLDRKGIGITQWARQHNVQARTVYDLLYGKSQGRRGEAHRVAVLLGLKDGEIHSLAA